MFNIPHDRKCEPYSEEKYLNATIRELQSKSLNEWDHAVLELIARDKIPGTVVGVVREMEAVSKLYLQGMIKTQKREPMPAERADMYRMVRSNAFQGYMNEIVMLGKDRDLNETFEEHYRILEHLGIETPRIGAKSKAKMFLGIGADEELVKILISMGKTTLTGKGESARLEKRRQIRGMVESMEREYREYREAFYANEDTYKVMLPIMVAMGLQTGAVMHLASTAGTEYAVYGVQEACMGGTDGSEPVSIDL